MAQNFRTARPEPVDLTHHFTAITLNRNASNLKRFYKYFLIPDIQNIAGGTPNHNLFPFDTLGARVALPDRFKPTPSDTVGPPPDDSCGTQSLKGSQASSNITVPHLAPTSDLLREIDVKTALQYGTAQGYPPLYGLLRRFTRENLHPNVPYAGGPEIILTCGNTDGFAKVVEALATPWIEYKDPTSTREGILCEEFAYSLALQTVRPRGLNIVPVSIDDQGMTAYGPGGLEDVLENWDFSRGKRPHLMYTVTVGQNPTGGTLGVRRRQELYALCVQYDIIIVEDDPYWHLQYPSAYKHGVLDGSSVTEVDAPGSRNFNSPNTSGYAFLDSLIPSYLSLDYQGRVIRLDTFSKTVAPGCRLGWITAQPHVAERLLRITESSTQQPSGFVQSLIAQLLLGSQGVLPTPEGFLSGFNPLSALSVKSSTEQGPPWKMDGWIRWIEGVRGAYERRMNTMCRALEEGQWLVKSGRRPSLDGDEPSTDTNWAVVAKTQMYSFTWPRGGMFVWLRVYLETHPLASKIPLPKLRDALWEFLTTKPYRVLALPGDFFGASPEIRDKRGFLFLRLSFAGPDEEVLEKASINFARGVRAFWMKKDLDDIEELVRARDATMSGDSRDDLGPMMSPIGGC